MSLTLSIVLICVLAIVPWIVLILARRYYEREKRRLVDMVVSWVTSPDPDTASPFAETIEAISKVIAGEITASIKATLMGVKSGQDRAEKALEADLMLDTNPLLSTVVSSLPNVRKHLRKNPAMIGYLGNLLQGVIQGKKPGNGHDTQTQFSLFEQK